MIKDIYINEKFGLASGVVLTREEWGYLEDFLYENSEGNIEEQKNILMGNYGNIAILHNIEVIEEERGKGMGNRLLSRFESEADECYANAVVLAVGTIYENNINLVEWYENRGYNIFVGTGNDQTPILVKRIE